MTQPLTDQQLTEIRDRVAAATDGPWYADGHEILVGTADDITRHSQWIGETCTTELPDWGNANGAFVAHARQDIPALLAEVTRDRAELAGLRAELEQTRQQLDEMTRCRDAALRALHRDDIETDIDVEETITNALHGPGWDWEDERTPGQIAREVAPAVRPALAKATQQLAAVLAVCDAAEHQATRWEHPLPVPEWVAAVRAAARPSA